MDWDFSGLKSGLEEVGVGVSGRSDPGKTCWYLYDKRLFAMSLSRWDCLAADLRP